MHIGTERQEFGQARQRKYVVAEEVQQTVPIRHEEVRVEREPVTESNCEATAAPDISEAEHEVTLHAERPVVETKAGPVERVRFTTDEGTVTGEVHKEEIETDVPEDRRQR
ncbi:YsnF/AvaK domain-containing protein [Streptomyces sp. NPDC059467]|uniref:YsnF/AvaK domain-containing protein n=1 Tax=Streptomyces sp. NPDC059467 TaxID=3346844 RepID=UPI0036B62D5E